jgi:hypothetical protein
VNNDQRSSNPPITALTTPIVIKKLGSGSLRYADFKNLGNAAFITSCNLPGSTIIKLLTILSPTVQSRSWLNVSFEKR